MFFEVVWTMNVKSIENFKFVIFTLLTFGKICKLQCKNHFKMLSAMIFYNIKMNLDDLIDFLA
jgi:hypothetical protein